MDNVSLFNQPNITDEQFFEVHSNLGHMLYFTPEWFPKASEDDSKLDSITKRGKYDNITNKRGDAKT